MGGGFVGAELLMSIMGMFGASFHWMRNFTLVTLFDIQSVLANDAQFVWKFGILAAVGVVTYFLGSAAFVKRDLPP